MGRIKSLTVMPNKIGTRQGRPASRFVWIPLSFVLLGLARVALLTIPFKRIAPLLGHDMQSAAMVPLAAPKEISRATHIGYSPKTPKPQKNKLEIVQYKIKVVIATLVTVISRLLA